MAAFRLWHLGVAFLFILVAGVALAEPVQQNAYAYLCQQLSGDTAHYIWLPQTVSRFFMGKTLNLRFAMTGGDIWPVYGLVQDGAIRQLRCGESAAADYSVSMSDQTAVDLATSLMPITTFANGWKSGRIRIEAHGAANAQRLQEGEAALTASDDEPVPERIRQYFEGYR